jgi:mono/diheme cytochrome c family protein
MSRFVVIVLLTAMTALGTQLASRPVPSDHASPVSFNKDVLPIVQRNCQTCHRPGGIAPMSFLTYESTRPWAKAMKTAVISRQMPPWFADPHYGDFRNAPQLTDADIKTLAAWVDGGAKEGDPADKPADRKFAEGWRIQPDVVVGMKEPYFVPAQGVGEIQSFMVPNPFKEDTWVSSIEIRPGDPSVVHHVIVQIPDQKNPVTFFTGFASQCKDCAQPAIAEVEKLQQAIQQAQGAVQQVQQAAQARLAVEKTFIAANGVAVNGQGGGSYSDILARAQELRTGEGAFTTMEAVYAPGSSPLDFRFSGSAKLIHAGVPIRIEVHYTPNGKETADQTQVGFTLAKAPAQRRFIVMAPEHLIDSRKPIPAGDANWETKGELTFNQDADLVWFMPHMHLRGKDMTFQLIYPDGRQETVLSAKFNFHWQLGYEVQEPIKVTKGTRMVVTAHYDNSANNSLNPTPDRDVKWGEMTSDEMMLPWFGVVVDRDVQPQMIATYKPGDLDGPFPMPPQALKVEKGVIALQPAVLRSR